MSLEHDSSLPLRREYVGSLPSQDSASKLSRLASLLIQLFEAYLDSCGRTGHLKAGIAKTRRAHDSAGVV